MSMLYPNTFPQHYPQLMIVTDGMNVYATGTNRKRLSEIVTDLETTQTEDCQDKMTEKYGRMIPDDGRSFWIMPSALLDCVQPL